jgi:hypothetical protein
MAQLKGKGSMTGINLIAKSFHNSVTKDGKSQYLDVQIDARDSRGPEQTNLHLVSERQKTDDGKTRFNNGAPYSTSQFEEIKKAAGDNLTPILNKDGEEIGTVYGIKGNVMPATRGTGLVMNTKTLEASAFTVDAKTLDNQFDSMRAAKDAKAAAEATAESTAESTAEAAAEAMAPGAEAVTEVASAAAVEVDEPAVG